MKKSEYYYFISVPGESRNLTKQSCFICKTPVEQYKYYVVSTDKLPEGVFGRICCSDTCAELWVAKKKKK